MKKKIIDYSTEDQPTFSLSEGDYILYIRYKKYKKVVKIEIDSGKDRTKTIVFKEKR